jgi:hypothetical protein
MKKKSRLLVLLVCSIPFFAQTGAAQVRNAVNAALVSWTRNNVENEIRVSNVIIQTAGNEVVYTLYTDLQNTITFKFNRITHRLHVNIGPDLQLSTEGTFAESGSNSILRYTDRDGVANILKFRRK